MKLSLLVLAVVVSYAFAFPVSSKIGGRGRNDHHHVLFATSEDTSKRTCIARDLLLRLVNEDKCFTSEAGAQMFADVCAPYAVYEDCYEPQPFVGKSAVASHVMAKAAGRKGRGGFRIDKISDGSKACGFSWTWTSGSEEGLRGTTFVELGDMGEIQYIREIPEPLFKPEDLTLQLLQGLTQEFEFKPPPEYTKQTPTVANELAKYLFNEVQGSSVDEAMRFFDESIVYRDFNYKEVLRGKEEVQKFIEDFNLPGIEFRAQRFDDGIDSTCFTWEISIADAPDTVKGISFYELDPDSRKIVYVRDVPESAIKPPILGKLARQFRPGLGVFQGVAIGSRMGL